MKSRNTSVKVTICDFFPYAHAPRARRQESGCHAPRAQRSASCALLSAPRATGTVANLYRLNEQRRPILGYRLSRLMASAELVLPSGQVPLFENVVARHLLKLKHALENQEGYIVGLPFLGDAGKREVDFLITVEGGPRFAVKRKASNRSVNPGLKYFGDRVQIPFWKFPAFRSVFG